MIEEKNEPIKVLNNFKNFEEYEIVEFIKNS
jgi:hypothetical protein